MTQYILRRLALLPVIMLFVTALLFLALWQLPLEKRVEVYIPSVKKRMTDEEWQELVRRLTERYRLDKPFHVQYAYWMGNLFQGNLGYSPTWKQPITDGLRQRIPATVELALFSMIPSVLLAISLGSLAARYQHHLPDYAITTTAFAGWAFPSFILGFILMSVFYAWLRWFPPGRLSIWAETLVDSEAFRLYTGMYTLDALLNGELAVFLDALRHLVLPAFTLAFLQWGLLVRVMRASLQEVLQEDYITTAKAQGLSVGRIMKAHARPNALLPVISTASVAVSMYLSSMVIVESLFDIDGVGSWAASAIMRVDVPVAVGFTLFSCLVVVLFSLAADILYAVIDPRVRLV